MRCAQVVANLLLLISGCRALYVTQRNDPALDVRGFGSGFTLPSSEQSPGFLSDVVKHTLPKRTGGGLEDIVAQATRKRPAPAVHEGQTSHAHGNPPATHSSQAHVVVHPTMHVAPAHLSQVYPQSGHPSQPSQAHVLVHPTIHAPPSHLTQHATQAHSAHLTQQTTQAQSGQPSRPPAGPKRSRKKAQAEAAQPIPPQTERLGKLASGLQPKPYFHEGYSRDPAKAKDTGRKVYQKTGKPRNPLPRKGAWWNRAGGRPSAQYGTSPQYEINKQYRERVKAQKAQGGPHVSEHPSGHQGHHPHGGGPGSPGAGSHAVSKRGQEGKRSE